MKVLLIYAIDLCNRMADAGLQISWRSILYPGQVGADLVEKMAQSGCVEVSLGMESGSDTILKKMNKRYRTEDVRHASDLLKANGIRRMGFLLLGGLGETRQTVMESLRFADLLRLEMVKVTLVFASIQAQRWFVTRYGSGNYPPMTTCCLHGFTLKMIWRRGSANVWQNG